MSPLPGWKVIPPGWSEHHRPTVNSTMTAPGTIHRITEGPPPFPKPEGWTGEEQIHSAFFRVQALAGGGFAVPTDQPTVVERYLLATPIEGCPPLQAGERGDLVHVAGRTFQIRSITAGSNLWEMDLICTENQTQQNPA